MALRGRMVSKTGGTIGKLWVSAAKEVRVLLRDREGVAILFVMPIAFVIIMSLALQDFFRQGAAPQFTLVLLDGDRGAVAQAVRHGASALPYFKVEIREQPDHFSEGEKSLRDEVRAGKVKYALLLPPGLSARHDQAVQRVLGAKQPADEAGITLTLLNDPALRSDHRLLAEAALTGLLSAIDMRRTQARLSGSTFDPEVFRIGKSERAR